MGRPAASFTTVRSLVGARGEEPERLVFLVSLGIAHWYWPEAYKDIGFAFGELITDELNPFVMGAVLLLRGCCLSLVRC
jgi:hypothetical protein